MAASRRSWRGCRNIKRQRFRPDGVYRLWLPPAKSGGILLGLAAPTDAVFPGVWLALWGVFTLFMFFGTLKASCALQFIFASLTRLLALLAVGNISGSERILTLAVSKALFAARARFIWRWRK